jgi:hypothetical protein
VCGLQPFPRRTPAIFASAERVRTSPGDSQTKPRKPRNPDRGVS